MEAPINTDATHSPHAIILDAVNRAIALTNDLTGTYAALVLIERTLGRYYDIEVTDAYLNLRKGRDATVQPDTTVADGVRTGDSPVDRA